MRVHIVQSKIEPDQENINFEPCTFCGFEGATHKGGFTDILGQDHKGTFCDENCFKKWLQFKSSFIAIIKSKKGSA